MPHARSPLGSQIWIERDDTPERIDRLFAAAKEAGLGHARLFLMWPWIEHEPGHFDFAVWDAAFDAAGRHGLSVKATLTANSGPWHAGTPGLLHSHTGIFDDAALKAAGRYVDACVERYRGHPALGQWILWNEPVNPGEDSEAYRAFRRGWLEDRYGGDLAALNRRWRTGFGSFAEVPPVAEVPHPLHRGAADLFWNSHRTGLDELACRTDWLTHQVRFVRDRVRALDPGTPLCVNPTTCHANQPALGSSLPDLGGLVDTLGASFHPAWQFTFAARRDFPALVCGGTRMLHHVPGAGGVEVTELQTGNTYESSDRPSDVTPAEVQRLFVAGLAGGATSVTGWCFNARSQDFEAGDWALLDDDDRPSPRSRAMAELGGRVASARERTGAWSAAPARFWVALSRESQARDAVREMANASTTPGRGVDDAVRGAAHLVTLGMQRGVCSAMAPLDAVLAGAQPGDVVLLAHASVLTDAEAAGLLALADRGAHVVFDGLTGRYGPDAVLRRPWPAGFATEAGLRGTGLSTSPGHHPLVDDAGRPAGVAAAARSVLEASEAWSAAPGLRFAGDGSAACLTRAWGGGRLTACRVLLAATLVHDDANHPHVGAWLGRLIDPLAGAAAPAAGPRGTLALPVGTERGELVAVLAPEPGPVRLRVAPGGGWRDLWSPEDALEEANGELLLPRVEHPVLLWRPDADA